MASGSEPIQMVFVEQTKGNNGLDKIVLREVSGFSAVVYLYGGQVTSWKTNRGEELLFTSKKTEFIPPKPIRGGIQLCFPEFTIQNNERFGFARNKLWSVDHSPELATNSTHKASIDLILKHSEEERWIFPHKFEFRLRITLRPDGVLTLISRIRNIDAKKFAFAFAYNAHFRLSDVGEVRIEGFETHDYLDNLKDKERFTEQGNALTLEGEVDRVYINTPREIAIIDHERKRTYVLDKDGLPDAGVWNPWDKKAKALPDFGNDEYLQMICVQPAACTGKKGVTINPGQEWTGKLEVSLVPSSYYSGELDPQKALSPPIATSKGGGTIAASLSSSAMSNEFL
ncbi:hypothetical protein K1719_027782 [Acacia pycnantha]|nr:hypothetical protein K1719_027782 [Acacia pycnantha]